MTRLPPRLRPLWPVAKRLHRWAAFVSGVLGRATRRLQGDRALPRTATASALETARQEPAAVTRRAGREGESLDRIPPVGRPANHWVFARRARLRLPDSFCLDIADGTVVGDYAATITPQGRLDAETSEYFGIAGWREHPIFLRRRLPEIAAFDGTLLVLGTRGASNYYHFLLDVLPRYGIATEILPDVAWDGIYVPSQAPWQRALLELCGLGDLPVVEMTKHSAVRARRLVVPSLANHREVAPTETMAWIRQRLRPDVEAVPGRRLYVSRGTAPNTRRLVCEEEVWPHLQERGFVMVEPGGLSPAEQIEVFSGAEVVVAPHGAALTNLAFAPPGVRVLEMFTASYVNECYWAMCQAIPGSIYRYLIDGDVDDHGPGDPMNRVQADIAAAPQDVLDAVDDLLAA